MKFVDIGITSVDFRAVSLLLWRKAEELRAIPIRLHPEDTVSVAVADPTDESLLPSLKLALGGRPVRLFVTTPSALRAAWAAAYPHRQRLAETRAGAAPARVRAATRGGSPAGP